MHFKLVFFFLLFTIIGCKNVGAVNPQNEMLIYHIKKNGDLVACLVGTAHLVLKPTLESEEFKYCIEHSNKLSFESTEVLDGKDLLEKYLRLPSDPKFTDLSIETQQISLLAFKKIGINEAGIKYLTSLHPAGIYRFLTNSKYLNKAENLVGNIDVAYLKFAKQKSISVSEFEGLNVFVNLEKNIPLSNLNIWISRLGGLITSDEKLQKFEAKKNKWLNEFSVQPCVDSALNSTIYFHTEIMGLPADSVDELVMNRNYLMAQNISQFLNQDKYYLFFVGAAHLGGERGLVKLLEAQGLQLKRMQ